MFPAPSQHSEVIHFSCVGSMISRAAQVCLAGLRISDLNQEKSFCLCIFDLRRIIVRKKQLTNQPIEKQTDKETSDYEVGKISNIIDVLRNIGYRSLFNSRFGIIKKKPRALVE